MVGCPPRYSRSLYQRYTVHERALYFKSTSFFFQPDKQTTMGRDDSYGVPLDDGEVELNDAMGVEVDAPPAPTAREQYPNPCGGWADVGSFRDAWWAVVWILSALTLFGLGVYNYTSGNYYRGSDGQVVLSFAGANFNVSHIAFTSDGECQELPLSARDHRAIAIRCDDDNLYIGGLQYPYEEENSTAQSKHSKNGHEGVFTSQCTEHVGAPGLLKHNAQTIKVKTAGASFPIVVNSAGGFSNGTMVVESSTCEVEELFGSARTARLLFLALFLAMVISVCQLKLMRSFPKETIIVTNIFSLVVLAGICALCAVNGNIIGAVIFGLCFVIHSIFLCLMWKRIPFAAVCLQMASNVALTYWGTIIAALVTLVVHLVFFYNFLFAGGNEDGDIKGYLSLAILFYWGQEVFSNFLHVTMSGVTSHWFFSLGGPGTPPYFVGEAAAVTLSAMKRSMWSLGSICFGSLIVAIIRTIRLIIRVAMRQSNALVRCILLCILRCIEDLVRYFNDYAYVQVAMFGKPYITAAKDTWALVMNGTAWNALVNDCLVDWVFFGFMVQGGLLTGLATYFASGQEGRWFVVGCVAALFLISLVMKLVYSGVMTVFIGFWHVCTIHFSVDITLYMHCHGGDIRGACFQFIML